ncbi:CDC48 family AAA ATPase [Candidatus Woesearchaeota archaeon]|nr:CDC48 family AAA ATPase [Candidatus Woesearchaeota archaeon]MBW3006135.1 CDC48 family AAA ATPase [Candidatus Woesearchaeota archaeon]
MKQEIKLKVVEAIQDDVNKGIVRIDSNFMKEIGIKPGDIVEILGGKPTVAMADRALPGDIGLSTIRMDGLLRKNAKTGIGEEVKVKKAEIKEAKKITIAPASERVEVRTSNTHIFKQGLLGRALVKGDIVSLGGTKRRRRTMTGSPFFDEVFSMMEEQNGAGYGFGFGDLKLVIAETIPAKQPVIVTEQTEILLNPKAVKIEEETIPEVTYEDIGGLSDEIKKIREMVELPLKHPEIFERLGVEPPKGVLLHGPPGTGKTLLAKAVANETNSHFILINGPEIMSKYYGQSEENIRKKFEEAEQNAPAIIFIDEIDAIATKREETKGEVEKRVVAQLLALMDGLKNRGRVVVIAATNVPNILDPALRRPGRFDRELEISVPNEEGRLNILKIHTRNMPLSKDVGLKELAKKTHGFVGADVSSLAKEAAMIVLRRLLPDLKYDKEESIPKEVLEKLTITNPDFREALKVVRPSALREVLIDVPNVKWEDIGGLEGVRQELIEAVEWPLKHPDAFKRMGVKAPKGILLYGAPGTGKTLMAKAVAHESEANFISVKGPELLSKWVGESEKAVREIFKKARQTAPTIIFFDEIDSLVPRRGASSDSHVSERVVNQLLTELDGLEDLHDIVIIGATNRPDMVDTALLRPGRFDRIILTPVPDEKSREEIFTVHTKEMPINGTTAKELAALTEGYAGADIQAVCREAAIIALREDMKAKEITQKHFEEALQKVRPSVTKEIEETYKELREHFTAAKAKEMQKEKPAYFG